MYSRFASGLHKFCQWVCYFFYLNIMWIACTLLGGVVFGLAPSTVSLYSVARKTAMGDEEIRVFHHFWRTYRAEFFRANGLGFLLATSGVLIFFNFYFFNNFAGAVYTALKIFMIIVAVTYVILLYYIFPVYVHYKMKLLDYLKYSIAFGFLHPGNFILMIITSVTAYFFLAYFQGFIPLIGVSLLGQLNMWLAYQSFRRIAEVNVRNVHINYNYDKILSEKR
ncbi:YesL family protein [Aquibacillus salsiterrae]|uniref:DUF624 domain-containing protein n=1 Tax=Aquibacillus salsiterrae TaxID=2950439 RepID=A0A9X3WDH8_9BACI|nr:DUF624 domain-containing protein [Aquibacillus salsiterrae]MDC3416085.1 DUF624 domain-containing protein [Aquibacillus salsiterrae]